MDQQHGPRAPAPQHSPDGRWRWDGQRWIPVPPPPPAPARRSAWPALACVSVGLVVLLGAGAVGAAAGPLVFRVAGSAIQAARGLSSPPSASSDALQPLDIALPPGPQAIPAAAATGPAPSGPVDAAAVGARLASTTVLIDAQLRHQSYDSVGTGIVLTAAGLVLTDEHVINDAESITARVGGTGRSYHTALIGVDLAEDVALLQLERASGLATATLGRSAAVAVGDRVVVIGYPHDTAPASVGGRIVGLSESVDVTDNASEQGATDETKVTYSGMLRSTVHSLSGQSGGPVVDSAGHVVGMDQVGGESDDYDIPIDRALAAAREIAAGHASTDVLIGAPADLGLVARTWNSRTGPAGARVVTVHSGTPARSVGLREGDVVTDFDGSPIVSASELRQALTRYHPGDRVGLGWTDARGHAHSVMVTLAAGSAP